MLRVLKDLMRDQREGRVRPLQDVRALHAGSLTLDFQEYFKFLNKCGYVIIRRDGVILGDKGIAAAGEAVNDQLEREIEQHFVHVLAESAEVLPDEPKPGGTPAVGVRQDAKYIRYESAGAGTVGTVYKGKHAVLGIEVAIKEIKDVFSYFSFIQRGDVVTRLKEELSAAAALNYPCVLTILDVNLEVSNPYYIMEYAPGGNLRQYTAAKGGHRAEDALIYFLQACHALRHAHAAGLIHQNLKPENVLVTAQGNIKLADFGMNRIIQQRPGSQAPQVFIGGAIAYTPPELLGPAVGPTAENDIYSLGIILYEMLTGNLPGRRSPLPSAVKKDIPAEVDHIFDKMTRDAPAERYHAIDEILDDFYSSFKGADFGAKGEIIFRDEGTATKK
jgi:serine/threonine protein kinase